MLSSGQSQHRSEPRTLRPGPASGWGRGSFGEGIPSSFSPGPKGTSRRTASVAGRSSTCLGNCPFPSIWRREGCFSQKYKSAPSCALGMLAVVRVDAAHSLVSRVDLTASQRSGARESLTHRAVSGTVTWRCLYKQSYRCRSCP